MNRIYRIIFVFFIIFPNFIALHAQSCLQGYVEDEQRQPIGWATVQILSLPDSSFVSGTVTDEKGLFRIDNVARGHYLLQVSFIGYRNSFEEIRISEAESGNTVVDAGRLILFEENTQLQEVIVSGRRKVIRQQGNALTVDLSHSTAASGVSALDVLQRLPGLGVGQNGLTLRGSTSVQITIDGKAVTLPPEQIANMLSGMQGEQLGVVEISSTPSANEEANGCAGHIVINTKKYKEEGFAFYISGGTGLSAHNLFPQANVSGNYRTGRVNLYGLLDVNVKNKRFEQTGENFTFHKGEKFLYQREGIRPIETTFYTYKIGMDWDIAPRHTAEVSFDGYYEDWRVNSFSHALMRLPQTNEIHYKSLSHVVIKEPYHYNTAHAKYTFMIDSIGKKIAFDADYIGYGNKSDGQMNTLVAGVMEQALSEESGFRYKQPVYIHIFSGKTDVDLPFKTFSLKTGLKYALSRVHNPVEYMIQNGDTRQPDTEDTDDYHYIEKIAAAYVSFARKWKNTSLEAGLRLEHSRVEQQSKGIDTLRNNTELFPSLHIGQKIAEGHKLDFSAARRINRPNYMMLSPVKWHYDAGYYFGGSSDVVPEYRWTFSLSYTLFNKYIFQTEYARMQDPIVHKIAQSDQGNTYVTVGNLAWGNRWQGSAVIPMNPATFWEITAIAEYSCQQMPVPSLQEEYSSKKLWSGRFLLNQQINLPLKIKMELSARYHTGDFDGYRRKLSSFALDGGIRRTFSQNHLTASLTFSDLLASDREDFRAMIDKYYFQTTSKWDSRKVFLTLKYHLGGTLKKTGEHHMEEKDRL